MNALAIIQANIIPTQQYNTKREVMIIQKVIEKVFKPYGARGPHNT